MTRLLARRGFDDGDNGDRSDGFAEAPPLLAGLAAASVHAIVRYLAGIQERPA